MRVESRDEIYFIFDFRVSFDADIELTILKVKWKTSSKRWQQIVCENAW